MPALPPHDITDELVERSPIDDEVGDTGRMALGWLSHFTFGAVSGAVYAVVRRLAPDPVTGLAYALSIWAVSYLGWVPASGFLPSALNDRPGRPTTMIAAHVVFGLLLGALVRWARPSDAHRRLI
jgi:hypothetical protein